MPLLQALAGIFLPLSILSVFVLHAPLGLALFSFLPAIPTLAIVAVEMAGLGSFCRDYGERPRVVDYARLLIGTIPYQLVLAAAAIRAVVRQSRGNLGWEKTAHVGAHLP
jgi:ABC-type proline/glycine betaine transport system permease subunit